MKKCFFILVCFCTLRLALGQNGISGPVGIFGPQYNAATTINSNGGILVGTGGLFALGGNITSADKHNPNNPNAMGRTELITFSNGGSYAGATTTAGIKGFVIDGYAAVSNQSAAFVLPLGNNTTAYPITVPAGKTLTAAYLDGIGSSQYITVDGLNATTTEFSQYYDIPSGIPSGSYTISYPPGLIPGNNSILSSSNTSITGTSAGTVYDLLANIQNLSSAAGTVTANLPATAATQIYLSTSSVILPITLLSFTGVEAINGNKLNWTVTNISSFGHFELQRKDVAGFTTIAKINPSNTNTYGYIDANFTDGINYYRLLLIDLDGSVQYSPTVSIIVKSAKPFKVYPNPATNYVTIETNAACTYLVELFAASGKKVGTSMVTSATGLLRISLNTYSLAEGIYIIKTTNVNANTTNYSTVLIN